MPSSSPNSHDDRSPGSGRKSFDQLLEIAKYQRLLVWALLMQMLQFALGYIATALQRRVVPFGETPSPEQQLSIDRITEGHIVLHIALSIFAGVVVFLLARKLFSMTGAIWAAVLQAVPCIALFALIVVFLKASETLNAHGFDVGNFGVSQQSLRQQIAKRTQTEKGS